jgi:hypothetical protein
VAHECSGVLAGAPREGIETGAQAEGSLTPRARGERQLSALQLVTIRGELYARVDAALYEPDRSALAAFVATVTPLSWSDPRIASLVQFEATSLEEAARPAATNPCSDMKSWAKSGYHTLSAGSREFEAAQKEREAAASSTAVGTVSSLLRPYEGRSERAVRQRTESLMRKVANALNTSLGTPPTLERALGVPESSFEESAREPVLGRGTTNAGSGFVVRRERSAGSSDPSCRGTVSVTLEEASGDGLSSSSTSSLCPSSTEDHHPSSGCGSGIESLWAAVPASVRTVRLTLSDGRTISSRIVSVPRGDGGPGGVYVQAVRGYSHYPVSLTELNAQGKVVLVVSVKAARCKKTPPPVGPTFVNLATGTTPEGQEFAIQGYVVHLQNQRSFGLNPLGIGVQEGDEIAPSVSTEKTKPKTFPWRLASECPPHEFAIVYGILAAPGTSVLARTPAGLVPLTTVSLAPDLSSGGPLDYGVFSTLPSELVVQGSDGSTLYTENLTAKAKEQSEFCEGYVEG